MERRENRENRERREDEKTIQDILADIFGQDFDYNDDLWRWISVYTESDWSKEKVAKDMIIHRFISNKKWLLDPPTFKEKYSVFIAEIDKKKEQINNNNIIDTLDKKLFRQKENAEKIRFIQENSDIDDNILQIAHTLSNNNPYHNFWHQLWVAQTAIALWKNAGCTKAEINLLAVCGLVHDAWHEWTHNKDAEEIAYRLAIQEISQKELEKLQIKKDDLHKLIIATKRENRGKGDDTLSQIIQDADIWAISRWPYYFLYATMGIVDEEKFNSEEYIDKEEKFIDKLLHISPDIFVSEAGKEILENPQTSLAQIKKRGKWIIQKAYDIRQEDITFKSFTSQLEQLQQE